MLRYLVEIRKRTRRRISTIQIDIYPPTFLGDPNHVDVLDLGLHSVLNLAFPLSFRITSNDGLPQFNRKDEMTFFMVSFVECRDESRIQHQQRVKSLLRRGFSVKFFASTKLNGEFNLYLSSNRF